MPRIVTILQARIGSSRLPGKVLEALDDDCILGHCIKRLKAINADALVLATSDLKQDDPVANFGKQTGVDVFRGSEEDVLDRFYQAALIHNADLVIRATGDNPFVDPYCGNLLLEEVLAHEWDYASSHMEANGYCLPLGTGLEVFSMQSLETSWKEGTAPNQREHVNEYILENQEKFKLGKFIIPEEFNQPDLQLTVDTPQDLEFVRGIIKDFGQRGSNIHLNDILDWWRSQE